jgi:hypothetical protein
VYVYEELHTTSSTGTSSHMQGTIHTN